MAKHRAIKIRGLRVHNLRNLNLELPLGKFIVVTGVSGSGKSSLAFDTLFAEGQRRYAETFSAYTRQFLERVDRPEADSIENIPPAIAIRQRTATQNSRSTVGTLTEINDYLRLLFAKIGRVYCRGCGQQIRSDDAHAVAMLAGRLAAETEFLVTFPLEVTSKTDMASVAEWLRADGFVRAVVAGRVLNLARDELQRPPAGQPAWIVVDRLRVGRATWERVAESAEAALVRGLGRCDLLVPACGSAQDESEIAEALGRPAAFHTHPYAVFRFSRHWRCDTCGLDYPKPEPRLYNFNNPVGACATCRGFGDVIDIDMDLVVPDKSKSIRQGAITPWNSPAYRHELEELLELADEYGIPVNVPFGELKPRHLKLIWEGVPERHFGGLSGFFRWLERKKYKMHIRVFLSRWRGYRRCPDCAGRRLKDLALATRVGSLNIAEICELKVSECLQYFKRLELSGPEREVGRVMLEQITQRLAYLEAVGLGYLTLARPIRTLSGGELQRVSLTKALGAGLVNTLYVLDEPSIGLHERDSDRLIRVLHALRDARNTVVVVEHAESIVRAADQIIDLGPGPGELGGRVVFHGPLQQLNGSANSLTADFLLGRRTVPVPAGRRPAGKGWLTIRGCRANNLKGIEVRFPLGLLCVVTGVSGSGKSSLVQDTLYPAVCQRLGKPVSRLGQYDELAGVEQLADCVLVDQSPIGRTSRSNPATYTKAFDEVRRLFARTTEARVHRFGPGHFSFNVQGGRCPACEGQGVQVVDMQFLADIQITCPECNGRRFRTEILQVKYRGRNIAEVLELSTQEAYRFFRGHRRVQERLEPLIHVGLGYLRLGQPTTTLSGGEAQRLKLAGQLASTTRRHTLLILDEPTTGLHPADILRLLDCFRLLLDAGHSLIVVEHNMDVIKSADWIIDLGPDAADRGGEVVACGTPEQIAAHPASITGRYLRPLLARPGEQRRRQASQKAC